MRRFLRPFYRVLLVVLVVALLLPPAVIAAYRIVPPPVSSLMVWRLVEGYGLDRAWRPIEEISPHLPRAVVAAEDNFFCRHRGVDWGAMEEAIAGLLAGERTRGASTISMQLAKNLFLWPERSYTRKVLELVLTFKLETILPKDRLLEIYLNVVEWGPGIYGAEAAARRYFDKSAVSLTQLEAALMATALPNPLQRSLSEPSRAMLQTAAVYRQRVGQLGPLLDCLPTPLK